MVPDFLQENGKLAPGKVVTLFELAQQQLLSSYNLLRRQGKARGHRPSTTHDAAVAICTGGAGVATTRAPAGRWRRHHAVLARNDRADGLGYGRASRAATVDLFLGQAKAPHCWQGQSD